MFGNSNLLKQQLEAKEKTIFSLQQEIDDYKKSMTSFSKQKMAYDEETTKLTKKYENQVSDLKQQIEAEKKFATKQFNAELAKIGVGKFMDEELSMESNTSPQAIYNKFASLSDAKMKMEFYNKHQKTIDMFMKELKKQ